MYMTKIDDSNGFMHVNLNRWSQPLHGFKFGKMVYKAIALPFGLSVSPPKFQMLNKVAIDALKRRGFQLYLYLDDRLVLTKFRPQQANHSSVPNVALLCLLTAFGGFLSLKKCQLKPVQRLDFLGFWLDTVQKTIEVPIEKYQKTMAQIKSWQNSGQYYDINELEKIRGKLVSWMIVIPTLRLFIREQNEVIRKAYETNNFFMQKSG